MSKKCKLVKPLFALFITVVVAAIDQFIKWLVELNVKPYGSFPILKIGETEWINFSYCENTGMSFSLFKGNAIVLIIFPCIIILLAEWYIFSGRIKTRTQIYTLAAAIGGGIGNLLDRFFRGYVIDFIDLRILNFAIFNFADICIVCCGIVFVVLYTIYNSREENQKNVLKDKKDEQSRNQV